MTKKVIINIQSISLNSFTTYEWVVTTLKLLVTIIGPKERTTEAIMLDTRAEANIMLYELAKGLGCLILSTEHFKLKIVSR